jgi:hypothetical protein
MITDISVNLKESLNENELSECKIKYKKLFKSQYNYELGNASTREQFITEIEFWTNINNYTEDNATKHLSFLTAKNLITSLRALSLKMMIKKELF